MCLHFTLEQKEVIQEALKRLDLLITAKLSEFGREQKIYPILVGRPADKQGLPVGLYNSVFDRFLYDMHNTAVEQEIAYEVLVTISSLCTAAAQDYDNDRERFNSMSPLIG
jgi:hypothetical protein